MIMKNNLVIPGADFSASAIDFPYMVITVKANTTCVIYGTTSNIATSATELEVYATKQAGNTDTDFIVELKDYFDAGYTGANMFSSANLLNEDRASLISVSFMVRNTHFKSLARMFYGRILNISVDFSNSNLSEVSTIEEFAFMTRFTSLVWGENRLQAVESAKNAFKQNNGWEIEIPISGENLRNMRAMFGGCNFGIIRLPNFDSSYIDGLPADSKDISWLFTDSPNIEEVIIKKNDVATATWLIARLTGESPDAGFASATYEPSTGVISVTH